MRRLIFNTQGHGISHEQIRRLENTQPGPGTYLESDMGGRHLGDEIMLLEGLEDPLADMGFSGSGGHASPSYDGFAVSRPAGRRRGRDFDPRGLGVPVHTTVAHPYHQPQSVPSRRERPDLYIGPNFYPLEAAPAERRRGRDFDPRGLGVQPVRYRDTPDPSTFFQGHEPNVRLASFAEGYERWSDTPPPGTWLDGFGDAASDRRDAMTAVNVGKGICDTGCNLGFSGGDEDEREGRSRSRADCLRVCQSIYDGAVATINSATSTSGASAAQQQALIDAKIAALRNAGNQAQTGRMPEDDSSGMSTNTMLLLGAGALGIGLLAVIALRK